MFSDGVYYQYGHTKNDQKRDRNLRKNAVSDCQRYRSIGNDSLPHDAGYIYPRDNGDNPFELLWLSSGEGKKIMKTQKETEVEMKTRCTHCGKTNSTPEGYAVDQMICVECKQKFKPEPLKLPFKTFGLDTKKGFFLLMMFGLIILAIGYIGHFKYQTAENKTTQTEEEISNITFKDIEGAYNWAYSQVADMPIDTGLQRDKRYEKVEELITQNYVYKLIRWRGEVVSVNNELLGDGIYVKFRHRPDSSSNVTVFFSKDDTSELLKLKIGDIVTYEGRIKNVSPSTRGFLGSNHTIYGKRLKEQPFDEGKK
jgi:hypothetical protein